MKTAIKITAISIITILTALSCSDSVDLTARDYSERNESNNAEYTNSPKDEPEVQPFGLTYSISAISEIEKEINVTFPEGADILRETNSVMTAKIKEFLNFYTYTNPSTKPATYTPSTISGALDYTFIRRNGTIITVKLDNVPNNKHIVYKIDASKYKVFGQVLDFNYDGKGGESYDDLYGMLTISGGAEMTGHTDEFFRPEATIDFTLSAGYDGTFNNTVTSTYITLIDTNDYGDNNSQHKKMVADIIDKIEFQKYDQTTKTWVKNGTVSLYEYNGTTVPTGFPAYFTSDRIYVNITPDDLGIYRVKATGVANLTSKENYGVKPAKININGNFLKNTIYEGPISYFNDDSRQWETDISVIALSIDSDSNKKNVVLEIYLDSIVDNIAIAHDDVWLEQLSLDKFNESFKLVYQKDNPEYAIDSGNSFTDINLIELKITNVKYSASKQFDATNTNNNCITVTLDSNYRINGNRAITLLLSPGFKYTGGHVTFGDPDNVKETYYNGTFFWRSYGRLGTINL